MNFKDIYDFVSKNFKSILIFYIVGLIVVFGIFWGISSLKKPTYEFTFSFELVQLPQNQAHVIAEDMRKLFSVDDSLEISKRLNLPFNIVNQIDKFDYTMTVFNLTHTAEVTLEVYNKNVIDTVYKSFIKLFNNYDLLEPEIQKKRELMQEKLNLVNNLLEKNNGSSQLTLVEKESEELENTTDQIFSKEVSVFYLAEKKASLIEDLFRLNGIKVLNKPVVPLYSKKPSKRVYFVFSNIIILSLIFVWFLLKRNID